jgi:16S rRNA G1207 methylase RsmC
VSVGRKIEKANSQPAILPQVAILLLYGRRQQTMATDLPTTRQTKTTPHHNTPHHNIAQQRKEQLTLSHKVMLALPELHDGNVVVVAGDPQQSSAKAPNPFQNTVNLPNTTGTCQQHKISKHYILVHYRAQNTTKRTTEHTHSMA